MIILLFYDLFVIVDEKEFSIEKSYNIIYMKSKTSDENGITYFLASEDFTGPSGIVFMH